MKNQRGRLMDERTPSDDATSDLVTLSLEFLVADHRRFERFLATTGFDAAEIRSAARSQSFLESLLDYICADQSLLIAFADANGYDPAAVEAARQGMAHRPAAP